MTETGDSAPALVVEAETPDPLRPRLYLDGQEIPVTSIDWNGERPVIHADFTAYYTQAYAEIGAFMAPVIEQMTQVVKNSMESVRRFAVAYGIPPCRVGFGPCFCHPKPFPAGRDYRRRTKHRNRRRR